MITEKVDAIELEAQLRYARRVLMLELNRFKVTGKSSLSEMEIQRSLDTLWHLERKGLRRLDYADLASLQRILCRLPSSQN
ncbi:MAG: hypothetical protein ABDH91_03135 [Bacteroidia bacterium]